jgi:hypothetical protein
VTSSPLVDDLDGDGRTEIVVGGGATPSWSDPGIGMVYIWEETKSDSWGGEMPWPMFHRDAYRTAQYPTPPRLGFHDEIRVYHHEDWGSTASHLVYVRNTGDGEFDWTITESISELTGVTPPSGTVSETVPVLLEISVTGIPTGTWQNLGVVTASGEVGGDAVFDSPIDATLYIFVGDVGRAYLPLVLRD